MRIKIMGFDNDIEFHEDFVNILEIPDTNQFANFLIKFNKVCYNEDDNEIVLLDKHERISFEKFSIMILDVLNINYNDKKIVSSIYDWIAKNNRIDSSVDEEFELIKQRLYLYMVNITNDLPFECYIDREISVQDILKLFNIKVDASYCNSILERIILFIDILSIVSPKILLMLVNLKSYLTEKELVELYKYILYKNMKVLLLENKQQNILKHERKNILDMDYYDTVQVYKE